MITQHVLIPQLNGNLAADILQLIYRVREKCAATRNLHEILDNCSAASAPAELTKRAYDANCKEVNVLLFDELFDISERIAAVVVLAIGDQQEGAPFMPGALHLVECHIDGIEERRQSFCRCEDESILQPGNIGREILGEPRVLAESYQKIFVFRIAGLQECHRSVAGRGDRS